MWPFRKNKKAKVAKEKPRFGPGSEPDDLFINTVRAYEAASPGGMDHTTFFDTKMYGGPNDGLVIKIHAMSVACAGAQIGPNGERYKKSFTNPASGLPEICWVFSGYIGREITDKEREQGHLDRVSRDPCSDIEVA